MDGQGLFYRDTWVEIDLDCIAENVQQMKQLLPREVELMAVVKANAYGHGDVQVAETALKEGASYLAVAFLDEAIALRQKGIEAPILVLGVSRPEDINIAAQHQITLTVFQLEWLNKAKDLLDKKSRMSLHIKFDTGMGRIGIKKTEELKSLEAAIAKDSRFEIEGVYTHFATADELNDAFFNQQLKSFNTMISCLDIKPRIIHASNSAGALKAPNAHFNAIRFGIGMYGLTPSLEMEPHLPFPLKEAFSLRSRLVHVKQISKGETISYGATYIALEDEWIGTLPIGYADGWIRKLQGQEVIVNGIRVPIVGRICMDQCMIKLPSKVDVGTVVTLIGAQNDVKIKINEIANHLDTINYEIPCMISNRVPRVYKRNGKTVELNNSILK